MKGMPEEYDSNTITDIGNETRILDLTEKVYQSYKQRRTHFERIWYRSILFLLGNQWIKWDERDARYRKRRLQDWVPTPVTNRYASTAERLVAVLSRIEPNWTFIPASESENDIIAARVADEVEDIICEENNIEYIRNQVARWLTYTGNAYLLSWAEQVSTPSEEEIMMYAMSGQTAPQPTYKLYTDIYSPFEVYADQTISDINKQDKVLLISRKSKEYVKKLYGLNIEENNEDILGLKYLESIGYTSMDTWLGEYSMGQEAKIPRVTLRRLIIQPSPEFPEGLYAVSTKDNELEKIESK